MSTEAGQLEHRRARRQGVRVALAVALGFCLTLTAGEVLPFLAPLFASQLLLNSRQPMALRAGMVLLVLVIGVGVLLIVLTGWLRDWPQLLLPLLWLIYLGAYRMQGSGRGAAAVPMLLLIAVAVPLLDILHPDLGESIVLVLAKAVAGGLLLAWFSHVLVPDLAGDPLAPAPAAATGSLRQSVGSASILSGMVLLCLVDDRLSAALVIPITVSSLLAQLQPGSGARAAAGLILVNLLGGVAAALAFAVLGLRPDYWLLVLLLLVVGLVFGGRAAEGSPSSRAWGGALLIFLVLFGLGVAPLPTSTAESFVSRVAYVVFAIAYTLLLTTLLWPRPAAPEAPVAGAARVTGQRQQ